MTIVDLKQRRSGGNAMLCSTPTNHIGVLTNKMLPGDEHHNDDAYDDYDGFMMMMMLMVNISIIVMID